MSALVLIPAPAAATAYVKSVEYVEITFGTNSLSSNASLTKNQNVLNCVPFASAMMDSSANSFGRMFTDVFLTAGSPPTVTAQRGLTGGTVTVGVYVVEFDPTLVKVTQSTFSIADGLTGPVSVGIPTVDLARTGLVFYYWNSGAVGYDDVTVEGRFPVPIANELRFERHGVTGAITGHWYTFEALNVSGSYAFVVQPKTFTFPVASGNAALSPSVLSNYTLVVGSYRTALTQVRTNKGAFRLYLSGCTGTCSTVTAESYAGNSSVTVTAFVISFNGGVEIQRGAFNYPPAASQATNPLSAVDTTRTMVWNALGTGPGSMMADENTGGFMQEAHQRLFLLDSTTVRGNRGLSGATAVGTWEAVEWELPMAPVADVCSVGGPGSWWNGSWGGRRKITFDNSGQATNLVNFPLLVKLDSTRIDYGRTQNAGQDIRFVDSNDTTLLAHEIELWNEAGTSYVWVKVPQIDASSTTDYVWMYYDHPTAPDGQNVPGTWDPSFMMVHHLNETAGPHTDSASAPIADNSVVVSVAAQGTAAGQIDGADNLTGTHHIDVADSPSLRVNATDSLTVEAWINSSTAQSAMIVTKEVMGEYQLWVNANNASFWLGDTLGGNLRVDSAINVVDGAWHYLVGRWNEATSRNDVFVDGASVDFATGPLGVMQNSADPLVIGEEGDANRGFNFIGRIDEVRVSKAARSNDWIRAQNLSMRDMLVSAYDGEENSGTCYLRSIGTRVNYGTAQPEGGGTTVTASAGSTTVVGWNTAWRSANRGRGDRINIAGTDYTIASVASETQLTLTAPFAGATGSGRSYWIERKFATLADWESCIDGVAPLPARPCEGVTSDSLVTDNRGEVGIAYDDTGYAGYPFAGMLVIDGRPDNQNTNATHNIKLTADGGNRHYGLPGAGAVVDNTGGTDSAIRVMDNFVTVEWLEIRSGGGALDGLVVDAIDPTNRVFISNNLIHDVPGGDGIEIRDADSIIDAYNNIIHGNSRVGISITPPSLSGAIRLLNNTVYNNTLGGISGPGSYPTVLLRNNIAVGNGSDFSVPGFDLGSSHNLGSDGSGVSHSQGATGVNSSVPAVNFVNAAAGNLHLWSPSTAHDTGVTLSALFTDDVDAGTRTGAWDIGADEFGVPAVDLRITKNDGQATEVPGTSVVYTITVTNEGPSTVTSLFVNDPVPSQIQSPMFSPSVGTYNSGTGLWTGLTLAPLQSVTLTLTGTIDPAATGDLSNTATVAPPAGFIDPNSTNDSATDIDTLTPPADWQALKTGPGAAVLGGTIVYSVTARNNGPANATGGTLVDTLPPEVEFLSSVPAGPDCNYDAASHRLICNLPPLVASGTYPVSINVRVASPGSIVNVASVSGPDPDIPGNNIASATTDVPVPSDEVQFFTVTSRNGENVLEWLNPAGRDTVRIRYNTGPTSCPFPILPTDGSVLDDARTDPDGPGDHDSITHSVGVAMNTHKYCYTIFVDLGGPYSVGRSNRGRPFDTACASCYTRWAYSVGSISMAPPGIGVDAVHAVANDNALHAMRKAGRAEEGTWPSGWTPKGMLNGPSQGRPSTINIPTGSAARVVFLGSQNGNVYAIDADAGGPGHVWATPLATLWDPGTKVQATPGGVFASFGGSRDYVLVGTRVTGQDNAFYALDRATGTPVAPWPFTGTGPSDRIGTINFQASVDYANHRVYFTSFARGGGFGSNTVWCLDFWTMGVVWARPYANVTTSPTLVGNRLYVGTGTGEVLALRASDGEMDWMAITGDGPVKGFVMVERVSGDVYFATTTTVHARRMDGSFKWERQLSSPSTPVILAGRSRIYVGDGDGWLHGLQETDGDDESPLFPIQMGDGTAAVGSVTIDTREGHLYVGTEAGIIYAVWIP